MGSALALLCAMPVFKNTQAWQSGVRRKLQSWV